MTERSKIRPRNRLRKTLVYAALLLGVALAVLTTRFYVPDPGPDAPRVLVSVDRTLWNRVGLNRFTYFRALRQAGLRPILVDYEGRDSDESAASILQGIDGLLLSGGGDVAARLYGGDSRFEQSVNAERDRFELRLLAIADAKDLPVLGLCRGSQLINVHRGGSLGDFRADSPRYRRHKRLWRGHPIELVEGSRLAQILEVSYLPNIVTWHGQYVLNLGKGLQISAYAPDGTPEAVEEQRSDGDFGLLGVQWHAEVLPWDARQERLFARFAEAAGTFKIRRSAE